MRDARFQGSTVWFLLVLGESGTCVGLFIWLIVTFCTKYVHKVHNTPFAGTGSSPVGEWMKLVSSLSKWMMNEA